MNDEIKGSIPPRPDAKAEAEAKLDLLYEIGRVLASLETLDEAAPEILKAICRNLHFELGELWWMDEQSQVLRLKNVSHLPSTSLENFVSESRQFEFTNGTGLPGRVWAKIAPVWVEKLDDEIDMPRRFLAEKVGFQSGVAFPILPGEKLPGVFVFFSNKARRADDVLLQMFAAIGNLVGQFLKREKIESELRESEDRYRAFIAQSTEGIWRFELDEQIAVNLSVEEQVARAVRHGYLAECNDAMAQMYGLQKAAELVGKRISDLFDMTDAANVEYLQAFIKSGYNLTDAESHEKDAAGDDKYFLNSLVGSVEEENLVRVWGTQRDITIQKRAEQSLRESEERFAKAFNASPLSLTISSLETGKLIEVNETFSNVTGFSRDEAIGRTTVELGLWVNPPEREAELEVVRQSAHIRNAEYRFRTKNGTELVGLLSAERVEISGESFALSVIQDITKRKRAEAALQENREVLSLAMQSSRMGAWSRDLANEKVYWGAELEEIFGLKAGTFAGNLNGFYDYVYEPDRELLAREVRQAIAEHRDYIIEFRFHHADGSLRWMEGRGQAVYTSDGNPNKVYGIGIDITERKRAEQFLLERESLALLNADVSRALIQDSSLQKILHACTEAVVKHLDAAFARIWTFNQEENVLELQASSGEYTNLDGAHSRVPLGKFKIGLIAAERKPHLTNSVVGDERVADQEWAEREKMVSFAGYPLIIEERLVGVVAMFSRQLLTDKTIEALSSAANAISLGIVRKQTEAERERLFKSEQQARETAEQANHAKDEFIALVSHELRSPLNAMLGWTRILQNQKPDEKTTDYALGVIIRNARAQSKLIEDLLDIARVSERKLRLEMHPAELVEIINAAVEIIKPAAESKNLKLIQTLDRAASFVTGDDDRLRQVVENLLSNAIKFTPDGGTIEVRLECQDHTANFTVSDTGQGISAEFLPQIFERFKQADHSSTRRHGGLGIGLSLARDLVELHGGTITAASAGETKGSIFTVTLPLRMIMPIKENSDNKGGIMEAQGKLSGFWILAVDDEADAREIVSFMLQMNGAQVTSANSAVEALEILKSTQGRLPDVLLSDISMPNESGYALLEKVRALPLENGGQIPAVALTAFNRPEDRQSAFEAGFHKHLGKPVEMDDLIAAIIETVQMNH